MDLARALRLIRSTNPRPERVTSFVGAGGKTTAMFRVARELLQERKAAVLVTATTHLGAWQAPLADRHFTPTVEEDIASLPESGVLLLTGGKDGDRLLPLPAHLLDALNRFSEARGIPLLIEADGSRQRPLKAPAEHEPPIPDFTELVVVCAGLRGLSQPLNEQFVHRPEFFGKLAELEAGEPVTSEAIGRVLSHAKGGLKNIPAKARRAALLNQAETLELLSAGGKLAAALLDAYHSVLVGSFTEEHFQAFEPTAGILLAAGGSERLGQPKQVLDWHGEPFARAVVRTALAAGLNPVIVVTGAYAEETIKALEGLPVQTIHNAEWQEGQASSIRAGLETLSRKEPLQAGAAIFLLVDQPQVNVTILRALSETHSLELPAILAPLVIDQRANPVLFDRVTFPDLMELRGDTGGRGIFHKHRLEYLPWHDDRLLLDVDTPEQYARLMGDESL